MGRPTTRTHWYRRARSASAVGRDVLDEATRWQRVEVDVLRMVACGLALALPMVIGIAAGQPGAGLVGVLGALTVSSSGQSGALGQRAGEILLSAVAGISGSLLGVGLAGSTVGSSAGLVAVSILAVVLGSLRPSLVKASVQFVVFMIIGANLAAAAMPLWAFGGFLAAGAVLGGVLTLVAYGTDRLVLRTRPVAPAVARRSWHADVHTWRERMTTLAGWHYPLRLGSCMVVAEILAHLLVGPHSYWILLTVVLVVQRDHTAALTRTLQRAVGTALGVLLGALLINAIPIWLTVALIAVIGAVRVHLKVANYAAYTLVMTPLVTVISGLGGRISGALLWERLIDTVLGCLISVLLGYLVWRRVRWTE